MLEHLKNPTVLAVIAGALILFWPKIKSYLPGMNKPSGLQARIAAIELLKNHAESLGDTVAAGKLTEVLPCMIQEKQHEHKQ